MCHADWTVHRLALHQTDDLSTINTSEMPLWPDGKVGETFPTFNFDLS